MLNTGALKKKFHQVFDKRQSEVLAEVIVDAYTDLVKTGDFNELKAIVRDLAESQKELAKAQKRTEEELHELVGEHRKTRSQVGGLSMTVGYTLEDKAFRALPGILKRDHGLNVKDRLKRRFILDAKGKPIEVNIIGEARKDGQKVMVVGEGKSQLSKNNVDDFIRKKLKKLEGLFEKVFPVLITYMISQADVEEYVKGKGIALYYSYDLDS